MFIFFFRKLVTFWNFRSPFITLIANDTMQPVFCWRLVNYALLLWKSPKTWRPASTLWTLKLLSASPCLHVVVFSPAHLSLSSERQLLCVSERCVPIGRRGPCWGFSAGTTMKRCDHGCMVPSHQYLTRLVNIHTQKLLLTMNKASRRNGGGGVVVVGQWEEGGREGGVRAWPRRLQATLEKSGGANKPFPWW